MCQDTQQAQTDTPENVTSTTTSPSRRWSVEELRRSSPLDRPTRTLRISEAEYSHQQNSTNAAVVVSRRPRSNPRSRTPMRYESPLDPDEFRRRDDATPTRITIQPTAGRPIGAGATRIHEERPRTPSRSRKQGPSHRKVRRWDNERFHRLAHELKGTKAGDILSQAHGDAHLYRTIYEPATSEQMDRFMHDETFRTLRDRFFDGELGGSSTKTSVRAPLPDTAEQWMRRIDGRLRAVLVKACANSVPATFVVQTLEDYLVAEFTQQPPRTTLSTDWWHDLLDQAPSCRSITSDVDDNDAANLKKQIEFYFPIASSQGGFHRLLLHAVAQFHGLMARSKVIPNKFRYLSVTGRMEGDRFYLLDHVNRTKVMA